MKKLFSIVATALIGAFSFNANAQNELVVGDVKVGDKIKLSDGSEWYVGANEITNGSFSMDPAENDNNIVGWTIAQNYDQMTTSNFGWHATGGYDGGAYIQAIGHTGAGGNRSIGMHWALETNTRYYFSFYLSHNSANNQYIPVITLTDQESTGGGQNEANYLIGMAGDSSDGCLGFANFIDEDGDGVGEWAQTACSFESKEYTWLQFNARWLKENKIEAAFDGFFLAKLYDPAEVSAETVAFISLRATISNAYSLVENELADYPSLAEELSDKIMNNGYEDLDESSSLEELQAAIDDLVSSMDNYKAIIPSLSNFQALLDEAVEMIESGDAYPGIDAFLTAIDGFTTWAGNGYLNESEDMTAEEYIYAQAAALKKAIDDYRFSQNASEDNPADYSFYIVNPNFESQGPWTIGTSGGDQRIKSDFVDESGNTYSGWNAWRNEANFKDNTIKQELTGLPNGYYTVTADLCTQDGCITDQHVFASSSAATSVSEAMTQTGWDPYVWETLTTAKVIVVDGKLTIGATSNGAADIPVGFIDYRGGWFCARNFKLSYLGKATDEEIATAIAAKFAEAEAFAATLHFAADKATAVEAVAAAKTSNDLDALKAAISAAEASEAEYEGVIAGSYANLQDSIANAYNANAIALAKVPVQNMTDYLGSAAATSAETPAMTAILRYYRDTLIPAVQNAEATAGNYVGKGKEFIENAIKSVVSNLASYTSDNDYLAKQVEALNSAITLAEASEIAIEDGANLTAYISNPTVDDTYAKGWTIKKIVGDGNGAKSGQQVDGNGSGFYMDTWNSAGGIRSTWYQVLNVPNGKYTISNIMRTSGTGAYLFASDKAPVTTTVDDTEVLSLDAAANNVLSAAVAKATPNAKYGIISDDEETVYTDSRGEIWMAAVDRICNIMGIQTMPEVTVSDLLLDHNDGSDACPENVDPTDWAIVFANNGNGRGWFNNSVEIEVTDHVLVLGVTCDYAFLNKTADEAFSGTWFSADNFKLVLDKVGDNTGWDPTTAINAPMAPATGIQNIAGFYSVSGARLNAAQKGINIVKMTDGSVKKVLVK